MQGHFKVSLMDAQGFTDEDFRKAHAAGCLQGLLDQLPTLEKAEGKNQVFDNFAGYTLRFVMSGGTLVPTNPLDYDGGNAALATICLSLTSSDPTYTEAQYDGSYRDISVVIDSVNSGSAGKRFIEDDIDTPELTVLPSGQEGIVFRSRFLYFPLEALTTAPNFINSLTIWHAEDADSSSTRRCSIARIRLKNSAGQKITIQKSSKQVLLVEYEFTLLCV